MTLANQDTRKTQHVGQGGKVHQISAYEAATEPDTIEQTTDPTADVVGYVHDVKIEKPLKDS